MRNFEDSKKIKKITVKKVTKDWIIPIAFAIALASTVRGYALARVNVDGPSMNSTLQNNDVMFEEKISLYTHDIKRGDIITFNSHDPLAPSYIKRVIGLAGDIIEIKDEKVYLNNKELKEDYLSTGTITEGGDFLKENVAYTVPKDSIFVMGDNRIVSKDSRYIGPVKLSDIQGKVFVRVYPFNSFKIF